MTLLHDIAVAVGGHLSHMWSMVMIVTYMQVDTKPFRRCILSTGLSR